MDVGKKNSDVGCWITLRGAKFVRELLIIDLYIDVNTRISYIICGLK